MISTQVGEISTAIIRKDYGFKEGPLADQPLRCRLELVKIVPQTPNWEIKTTDLKIEAVNAKRCLGNAWVARNDIPRAIRRYGAAIEIGDSDYDIVDEDEKKRLREAVAACKLNRAMCHLKVKNYQDCLKDCSDVLDIDSTSVKALFRQGKCFLALDKWDAAKESFRKVLELDDGNMEARRGLQSVPSWKSTSVLSALGDDVAALAPSSGEEPTSPRHRAGVASMAWRSTRQFRTNAP